MIIGAENGTNYWHSLPKSVETVSYPKGTEGKIE